MRPSSLLLSPAAQAQTQAQSRRCVAQRRPVPDSKHRQSAIAPISQSTLTSDFSAPMAPRSATAAAVESGGHKESEEGKGEEGHEQRRRGNERRKARDPCSASQPDIRPPRTTARSHAPRCPHPIANAGGTAGWMSSLRLAESTHSGSMPPQPRRREGSREYSTTRTLPTAAVMPRQGRRAGMKTKKGQIAHVVRLPLLYREGDDPRSKEAPLLGRHTRAWEQGRKIKKEGWKEGRAMERNLRHRPPKSSGPSTCPLRSAPVTASAPPIPNHQLRATFWDYPSQTQRWSNRLLRCASRLPSDDPKGLLRYLATRPSSGRCVLRGHRARRRRKEGRGKRRRRAEASKQRSDIERKGQRGDRRIALEIQLCLRLRNAQAHFRERRPMRPCKRSPRKWLACIAQAGHNARPPAAHLATFSSRYKMTMKTASVAASSAPQQGRERRDPPPHPNCARTVRLRRLGALHPATSSDCVYARTTRPTHRGFGALRLSHRRLLLAVWPVHITVPLVPAW
ncbi:hypothetical protein DFH06DRAFT_1145431 [Mycena polygramma]|nr:hypothetical protein DFH06DRAFT_1145431 [Mycena polygramma]